MKHILKITTSLFANLINPSRLPVCRFEPSCSRYASQAIDDHGAIRGVYLTICRLIKCQPWGPSGFDPVPTLKNRIIRKA